MNRFGRTLVENYVVFQGGHDGHKIRAVWSIHDGISWHYVKFLGYLYATESGRSRIGRAYHMKADRFGCHTLQDFARRSLNFRFFVHSGESEGMKRRVGKLLERR